MSEENFTNSSERLLPTSIAAHILQVPERSIRWWAKTSRIPAVREGVKLWKFRRSDVIAMKARLLAQRMEAA